MNKKAQEINYIIFLCVFLTVFGIIGMLFTTTVINKETNDSDTNAFLNIINWINSSLKDIPVIGQIMNLFASNITFSYIHPYVALIYTAIVGVPVAYIILRLLRGGG